MPKCSWVSQLRRIVKRNTPSVLPIWKEAARVMKPGANLLAGIVNPLVYLSDSQRMEQGEFKVCHKLPYSDLASLSSAERQALLDDDQPFCFGHTLADQLGGQIDAGLAITGFFEAGWSEWPISEYIPTYIATNFTKLPLIGSVASSA